MWCRRLGDAFLMRAYGITALSCLTCRPRLRRSQREGSVWRILAWGIAVVFGFLVNALAPLHAQAQQAPEEHRSPAQVVPGRLGAKLRELVPESVKALGLIQEHAVLVLFSFPGGPAARAGLQPGDVILNLQGVPVSHLQGFISALQSLGVGQVA